MTLQSLIPTFLKTETFQSHLRTTIGMRHKFEEWIVVEHASFVPLYSHIMHGRSWSKWCFQEIYSIASEVAM